MLEGPWRVNQSLQAAKNTWKALTNEAKRPRTAREVIHQEVLDMNPTVPVDLDVDLLLKNFRTSHRAAALSVVRCLVTWRLCLQEDRSHERFWKASELGE